MTELHTVNGRAKLKSWVVTYGWLEWREMGRKVRESVAKSERVHCKKRLTIFPSPAGMSLTKLSQAGNNLSIPGQGEFGK